MDPAHQLLREVFGFDAFRTGQEEIVTAVSGGENVLAIMPTGGGKSLCYQLPALMGDGLTVVISPLIALMRDQVRALCASGVAAGALTSGNTEDENQEVLRDLHQGQTRLLYLAPERLATAGTMRMLQQLNIRRIAVDEAHCVSQWGHDFRPDYLRIGDLRRRLNVPLAAFTATADAETRDEIIQKLFDGQPPRQFLHGFDRPNIHLAFQPKNNPRQQILAFVGARKGQSGIIYCGTRARTETLSQALNEAGHHSVHYHGGMQAEARRHVEEQFNTQDGLVVVATVAFGMGVDKPDIRWVAHSDLPKSIEAYYQEIGRAGRDGAAAETLTLYGPDDIRLRRSQIDESLAPPERRNADHGRLNALLGLAEAHICRRMILLHYFGETATPCGNCDLCDTPPEIFDGTETVQKALSAILRTDEYFGAGHIIDVLTGTETDKIRARGHHHLPTFGVGQDLPRKFWQGVIRQMLGQDLIRPDPERHGGLRITEAAHPILRGEKTINLRKDVLQRSPSRPAAKALVSDEDAPLLSALKAKRRALAEAANVPAYIVFPDRTLIEMAQNRPNTLDDMARINGVGAKKLEQYGSIFLAVITGEHIAIHPTRRKLAGQNAGELFDELTKITKNLERGETGLEKPLSCSTSLIARITYSKPRDMAGIIRIIGEVRAERFGQAFLDRIRDLS